MAHLTCTPSNRAAPCRGTVCDRSPRGVTAEYRTSDDNRRRFRQRRRVLRGGAEYVRRVLPIDNLLEEGRACSRSPCVCELLPAGSPRTT